MKLTCYDYFCVNWFDVIGPKNASNFRSIQIENNSFVVSIMHAVCNTTQFSLNGDCRVEPTSQYKTKKKK